MTTWFYHFAFDAMGDLGFGQSFSLIPELDGSISKPHFAPALLSQGMSMLRFFSPTPWLGQICLAWAPYVPFISQKWTRALRWAAETCDAKLERAQTGISGQDVFSHFIATAFKEGDMESLNRLALYGDAFAVAVAGSHTVALILTFLFYELAQRPALQEALRNEIDASGSMVSTEGEHALRVELNMPADGTFARVRK
ncbi:hypothetical protein SLS62_008246 [Diatrype stigma]|uniref:Cytochrome P450 n=1 Tax=Diatrype stigma TaxID=117547 RepID=A0AAN9ULX4_9PEZI